jgi:flagellar protein FliL
MAKAPAAKQEEPVAPKGKKTLVIIMIAVLLAVLVLGGAAAFLLLKKKPGEGEEEAPKAAAKHEVAPAFLRLEPFTVKLQPFEDKPDQYLQVVPELKLVNLLAGEKVKQYMPEIRHNMLLILSAKNSGELSSPPGVEKLSAELRSKTNQILGAPAPKGAAPGTLAAPEKAGPEDPVQEVLFTSFIIQ